MRIIAGQFGGRTLVAPRGDTTRPTSDRVKEALFSILGPPRKVAGQRFRVLDLFAGSGALGLEALSRGADECFLVDENKDAVASAERNVAALNVGPRAHILHREVGIALRTLDGPFDWVFLDPPYLVEQGGAALDRALRLLGKAALLGPSGLACAEHEARTVPAERFPGLKFRDRRSWGDTSVSFYVPAAD